MNPTAAKYWRLIEDAACLLYANKQEQASGAYKDLKQRWIRRFEECQKNPTGMDEYERSAVDTVTPTASPQAKRKDK